MNRRQFTRRTLAALGALVLPAFTSCKKAKKDAPVLILGAGMAGLSAAKRLRERGFTNIKILEGRNRIGGRMWTDRSWGLPVDLGASWIHGSGAANPITGIANQAGAALFETDDESLLIYDTNGTPLSEAAETQYYSQFQSLLQGIAGQASVGKSVLQAIGQHQPSALTDPVMLYQLSAYMEFDAGGDIEQLSSLYWDDDENFNGKEVVLPGGYDAVVNKVAEGLGDALTLNAIVSKIDYSSGKKVVVSTSQGTFEGEYCICTLPLGVLKNNAALFAPALPAGLLTAMNRLRMGAVNKVALLFPSVFWDNNLQYFGYCPTEKGKFPYFVNAAKFLGSPALVTFGLGNYGLTLEGMTDAQIQTEVMTTLRTLFGNGIPDPAQILVTRWTQDPFAGGSYSFIGAAGSPADYEAFETPVDERLFFAGEHTIATYRGTVHGAYLSGVRAANGL